MRGHITFLSQDALLRLKDLQIIRTPRNRDPRHAVSWCTRGRSTVRPLGRGSEMAQSQIRIERKTITSKGTQQAKQDSGALDLRTPSGRKLPY